MRILFKLVLFPISLLLSVSTAFLTFLLSIGTAILYLLMILCIFVAIGSYKSLLNQSIINSEWIIYYRHISKKY
mgnify:CR=1 FL=1